MFSAPKLFFGLVVFIALLLIVGPSNVFAAPATPTGLSQIDSPDESINVRWNKVSGASGYQINISKPDGSDISSITVGEVDSALFTRPIKGQEYQLWINACDSSGCSDPSAKITAKTGTAATTGTATAGSTSTSSDHVRLGAQPVDATNYRAPQHADYTMNNLEHSMICMLSGISPQGKCLGVGSDGQAYLFDKTPGGGALGQLSMLTTAMYDRPPVSSSEYLAQMGQNFGIVSEARAQVSGSGSSIITPVLLLWQVVSNIAYLIYIVIFIVIGFMIMFRQKMNPQTVITAQSALPGLVIGMILIYFSYFISALIADFSFLGVRIVAGIFDQVKVGGNVLNAFDPQGLADNSNIVYFFTSAGLDRGGQNFSEVQNGFKSTLQSLSIGKELSGVFGAVSQGLISVLAGVGGFITGLLVTIVLVAALAIQFFRLFIKLLNSYIMILITTVLGPMFILMGTVPGKANMTGFWWKNLLGHSLTFPAVFATFLFAGMILKTDPGLWQASPPFFGGLDTSLLKIIVAYGIILGTPAVPDIVKKAVGAQDLGAIGTMGAAGFAAGNTLMGKSVGKGYGLAMKGTGISALQEGFARTEASRKGEAAMDWKSGIKKSLLRVLPTGK